MNTCDICLKTFKRRDNMLRHKKNSHPNMSADYNALDSDNAGKTSSESESEVDNYEQLYDDVKRRHVMVDNYDPWESVIQKAFEQCDERFQEEVEKLLKRSSLSQSAARRQVYDDMQSIYRKAIVSVITCRVMWFDHLRRDQVYKAIKRTAFNLIKLDDYESAEAWKSAINQRKYLFDSMLEEYEPPVYSDKDGEDQTDDDEEEQTEEADVGDDEITQ